MKLKEFRKPRADMALTLFPKMTKIWAFGSPPQSTPQKYFNSLDRSILPSSMLFWPCTLWPLLLTSIPGLALCEAAVGCTRFASQVAYGNFLQDLGNVTALGQVRLINTRSKKMAKINWGGRVQGNRVF